jgi:DNA-binding protein H-NS
MPDRRGQGPSHFSRAGWANRSRPKRWWINGGGGSQFWPSSTIETPRKGPNLVPKGDHQRWDPALETNHASSKMNPHDLNSMSMDGLWSLHELVALALARKISAEKARLDRRLQQLGRAVANNPKHVSRARRSYPQVNPKFRNPAQPAETWAGRGKQPRWLTAQLKSGKKLDDFRIQPSSDRALRIV